MIEPDTTPNEERAYHAFCPALKGCHTWERTYDKALANIGEAVEVFVDDLRAAREQVPLDSEHCALEWPTPAVAINV